MVRQTSELETNIVSVERVKEYSEIPTEAEWIYPDSRPPDDWPMEGRVHLDGFDLKYRDGLPLVLKNIDCAFEPGEKVLLFNLHLILFLMFIVHLFKIDYLPFIYAFTYTGTVPFPCTLRKMLSSITFSIRAFIYLFYLCTCTKAHVVDILADQFFIAHYHKTFYFFYVQNLREFFSFRRYNSYIRARVLSNYY